MAFIGSLITTVKANTSQFAKKMKSAKKIAKAFGKTLKNVGVGVAKFGLALGAVAVAALVVYTVKAFKAIDVTAKLARELEITTAALVGYQLAAGLSGVSTEVLNKAIGKMARTVGEARSGITTGTKALEDFGLKVEDLQGLTTQQVFEKFADEISKIPDPMERAAKASLIFGRAGGKLLNFLTLGSAGLAEVRKEVAALGVDFDEIDAAKVEQANDAILKMQTVATGLGNTLAIAVAPFVEDLATRMSDFIKESGGIDTIVNKGFKETGDIILKVLKGISFLRGGFLLAASAVAELRAAMSFGDISQEMTDRAIRLATEAGAIAGDIIKFEQKIKKVADDIADDAEKTAKIAAQKLKDQKALNIALREQQQEEMKLAKMAADRQKDLDKIMTAVQRIFEETRTPLEKVEAEIVRIMELMSKGLDDSLSEGLQRKLDQLEKAKEKIESESVVVAKTGIKEDENLKKIEQQVKDIFEETRTPLEKVEVEIERLMKLMREGFGGELADGLQRKLTELEKARADILKGDTDDKKLSGIGGFKVLDLKNVSLEGIDRAKNAQEKQLTETKKQTGILQGILDASNDPTNIGVAVTV